jgi:uncharacterized protein (DUF3084 family)
MQTILKKRKEKKRDISKLHEQIRKRYEDIKNLEERKEILEMETLAVEDLRDGALQDEKIITAKLRQC